MNREIKFRAYNKFLKQMFPVKYLSDWYVWGNDADFLGKERMENTAHDYSPKDGNTVVMQFTGCKLKNGTELYEGDVLAITHDSDFGTGVGDTITEITYQNGAFVVEDDFGECDLMPIGWALEHWDASGDVIALIGNIYENPALIKV